MKNQAGMLSTQLSQWASRPFSCPKRTSYSASPPSLSFSALFEFSQTSISLLRQQEEHLHHHCQPTQQTLSIIWQKSWFSKTKRRFSKDYCLRVPNWLLKTRCRGNCLLLLKKYWCLWCSLVKISTRGARFKLLLKWYVKDSLCKLQRIRS